MSLVYGYSVCFLLKVLHVFPHQLEPANELGCPRLFSSFMSTAERLSVCKHGFNFCCGKRSTSSMWLSVPVPPLVWFVNLLTNVWTRLPTWQLCRLWLAPGARQSCCVLALPGTWSSTHTNTSSGQLRHAGVLKRKIPMSSGRPMALKTGFQVNK